MLGMQLDTTVERVGNAVVSSVIRYNDISVI